MIKHSFHVTYFDEGLDLDETLTGREFEDIIEPSVEKAISVAETALSKLKLPSSALSGILLAGGTSQLPLVKDTLQTRFGCEIKIVPRDLMWLIAKGAAIRHRDLMKLGQDPLPQTLGADLYIETFTHGRAGETLLVPAHQALPYTSKREFSVNANNSDLVIQLLMTSGTHKDQDYLRLARREIHVGGQGLTKISVKVEIDKNMTVRLSVLNPQTNLPLENFTVKGDMLTTAEEIRAARAQYGLEKVRSNAIRGDQRYAIGIDLGTTTCEAYVYDLKEKVFLRGIEEPLLSRIRVRADTLPNFTDPSDIGNPEIVPPDPTLFWNFKVDIGESTEAEKYVKYGRRWPPEILSAYLLAHIWHHLREKFGSDEPLTQAVVTVPSDFSPDQKALVENAARIAGIESPTLLTEPTAAALAYVEQYEQVKEPGKKFLIFDFGGGTTDVSIIETQPESRIHELERHGDNSIGGKDLTDRIAAVILDRFILRNKLTYDEATRARLQQRLVPFADTAKIQLSRSLMAGEA